MEKKDLSKIKILNKIKQFEKTGEACATDFLDPLDVIDNHEIYKNYEYILYGGYEEAERKVLVIGTENVEKAKEFICIFEITSNKPLEHRAILGSILGLGIKREVVGDIIIQDEKADIFVLNDIAKFVENNFLKVGNEKIKIKKITSEELLQIEDKTSIITTTVASLRIDAAISACFGVSRELASQLVLNEKVKLNYKPITNVSKQIHEDDLISVRGYGRFVINKVIGETKKGRIRVELKV